MATLGTRLFNRFRGADWFLLTPAASLVTLVSSFVLMLLGVDPIWVVLLFSAALLLLLGQAAAVTPWSDLWRDVRTAPFRTLLRWSLAACLIAAFATLCVFLDRFFGPQWMWVGAALLASLYVGAGLARFVQPSCVWLIEKCHPRLPKLGLALAEPKLPYWIQSADYSSKDYPPVDLRTAERVLREYNWHKLLAFKRALVTAKGEDSQEWCPPGIGFIGLRGRVLHICPNEDGTAYCNYILPHQTRPRERQMMESLDPSQWLWHSAQELTPVSQYRALQVFYRQDFDELIRLLNGYLR